MFSPKNVHATVPRTGACAGVDVTAGIVCMPPGCLPRQATQILFSNTNTPALSQNRVGCGPAMASAGTVGEIEQYQPESTL